MDANTRLWARPELTERIREQGRLQTWIGSLIGADKSYVTHVLKGRRSINLERAITIADALGEDDITVLFDFAGAPTNGAKEEVAA